MQEAGVQQTECHPKMTIKILAFDIGVASMADKLGSSCREWIVAAQSVPFDGNDHDVYLQCYKFLGVLAPSAHSTLCCHKQCAYVLT